MKSVRENIGGLGNLLFKESFIYALMKRGIIPDLYVQSPKYWADFEDEIRERFSENLPEKNDKISLHIRRGDYVDNPFYVDLTKTEYYQKAVKEFPGKEFMVFTDDPDYAEQFMKKLNVPYTLSLTWNKEHSEVTDLNYMAACEGHIIANSSFSWWGAFLGGGKTVAPKQWFSDGVQRTELHETWIQL